MDTVSPPAFVERSQRGRRGRSGGLRKNNPKKSGINRMAIASVVTGVLLFPIPLVALALGGAAMGQIGRTRQTGKSLAVVGIALGVVGCLLWISFWVLVMTTKNPNLILSTW